MKKLMTENGDAEREATGEVEREKETIAKKIPNWEM